jgi:hypothetical protein
MDNFDICQKIYDSMEHPDYYDNRPSRKLQEAHNLGICGDDCIICKYETDGDI